MDAPSVGRIVHYVAYGTPGGEFPVGACRAAIITEVAVNNEFDIKAGIVSVCVLNPAGFYFTQRLAFDPDRKPGTWHWPERVS